MRKKRAVDLVITVLGAVAWVPAVIGAALLVLLFSGRPVFYRSVRRVSSAPPIRVVKFRTMVKNAAEIANRETVPVTGVRFLNISPDSPLYTRVGRLLERVALTELPQFVHVFRGQMSIIGNRPLPQNVIDCLREEYADAGDRFLTPAGLTGPSQLVGRDELSDEERLTIEGTYCRAALRYYSVRLDVLILLYTVLIVLRLKKGMEVPAVLELIDRYTQPSRRRVTRIHRPAPTALGDGRPGLLVGLSTEHARELAWVEGRAGLARTIERHELARPVSSQVPEQRLPSHDAVEGVNI
jgi:lipopolysaccharide/colanic/teichoic acid biosynthesis glycosyltransferase